MQESFIKFALGKKVLQFGDFTTKAVEKVLIFLILVLLTTAIALRD